MSGIDFYFSIGSTYTYLSVTRILDVEKKHQVKFNWKPFSVRAIMQEMNNIPFPKDKMNKVNYMWRDIERRAEGYGFLVLAVVLGVTSNSFAKSAEGFTLLFPSIVTALTIVACMYALSMVMKNIPMGITYASFAGLTIIATVVVGIFRFNQVPNFYSLIGLTFIIIGVLMVNLLGNN